MKNELKITAHDGGSFGAYLVYPETDLPAPAVIVIQEIFGVNAVMRSICDNVAKAGFTAICPDLFWRQEPDIQLTDKSESEWQKAFALFNGFNVDLGVEDLKSTLTAVRALKDCTGKVGTIGYCLGGTLLSIAAAAMARDGDDRLKSITFLAAQADFTEAGELMLFINESQVAFLEDMMWEQGFLDSTQMAGAFQMLRSADLVWSHMIRDYLMGERSPIIDLMAWNADATRLPYRMHSEYLRRLFLNNDLAEGRYTVAGKPIALTDIRAPIFAVGAGRDHVAPWQSTYKINLLTDTDVTYLLTTGGHNAGIVSEPGHDGHSFQIMTKTSDDRYVDPESYLAKAPRKDGSWWPEWTAWLATHSGVPTEPPSMGATAADYAPRCDAPGTYVLQQ